jgi:DNA-binding NarL/FixJ family response regulator
MHMNLKHYVGYILDDHNLFSEALSKVLETYLPFESVFVFSNPKDMIHHLINNQSLKETFLFLDYYIGEKNLPSVLSEIKRVSKSHKLVVISSITSPVLLKDLLSYKIDGIIHKSDTTGDIVKCVQEISNRKVFFTPYIRAILASAEDSITTNPFSEREMQLIPYFVKGYTIDETAEAVNLSPYTIATHRKKMFRKVKCNNISELLASARALGIIGHE